MDFTLKTYKKLLRSLMEQGYVFQTFEQFVQSPAPKSICLRHDVDLKPQSFWQSIVAEIYKELGILKKGLLAETDRSGLVAEYVGHLL